MFIICGIYNATTNIQGDYCKNKAKLSTNDTLSENELCKVTFLINLILNS